MSFGYPVMLELAGRRCVVIGAQAIREGKVEGMLAAGADDVLVVEPSVDERFEGVAGVRVERRAWRPGDLDGAFLAVASSDDAATRAAIAREARARRVLVNLIDDIPQCGWAAPAVVRRGRPRARDRHRRRVSHRREARSRASSGGVRSPNGPRCSGSWARCAGRRCPPFRTSRCARSVGMTPSIWTRPPIWCAKDAARSFETLLRERLLGEVKAS